MGLGETFTDERLMRRIGESGLNISGGERQRIAIAQCLLRGASVILLDEATSQLDETNQQNIRDVFHRLCDNGTTIISVAHRSKFNEGADYRYELKTKTSGFH